jgi:hypothetical protein
MLDKTGSVFFTIDMNTTDAIHHFGTASALATAVGISKAAVSQWGDLVPLATAARLEKLTNGKLRLDMAHYPLRVSPTEQHAA